MSLLPMKSISGSLPVIFIEARLQGPPEIVFSQMGISFDASQYNVALLMRTSGVLLIASVGSYMMYRICSRLLGRDFVWTILEQARFDLLVRSDAYLLNPRVPFLSRGDDNCSELADDELSDGSCIRCGSRTLATLLSPENSPSRRHFRRIARARQLRRGSIENLRRQSYTSSKHDKYPVSVTSQSSSHMEFNSSEKSASLHLVWDDPQWDEEADFSFHDYIVHCDQCSIASDVSNMTEFRGAKEVFGESDDYSKMDQKDRRNRENGTDHEHASSRGERSSDLDTHDFIRKSCMTDSKHLYQIATECITTTDSMSISSERSSRSFISLKKRFIANASTGGLLELVQSSNVSPQLPAEHLLTSLTDSGISKGTVSTSILLPSIRSSGLNNSFEAEIFSSEDETTCMGISITLGAPSCKNSVVRRTSLNLINEDRCSPMAFTQSTEWFDDDCNLTATTQNFCRKSPLEEEMDGSLAACFSCSNSSKVFLSNLESRRKHLYSVSRDLMAWTRERFAAKSAQQKALHSLYISHQRWRRIGLKRSSDASQQFLLSLVHSMLLHGIPFFGCSDMLVIAKGIHRAFSHYEFVRKWCFSNEFILIDNKEEYAISLLQNLWDLQHGVRFLEDEVTEVRSVEAVRLLAMLWIVHCFEKTETGQQQQCSSFYEELFGNCNPRQIIEGLCKTELSDVEMILLADALRIRLELLDCSCGELDVEQSELPRSWVPQSAEKEITSRPILTFLKSNCQNFLYPLYHSPK